MDEHLSSFLKISLVIPVFNESATIQPLLRTIRAQTRQPDEVIFVDAGSSDDTVALLHRDTAGDSRFVILEAGPSMPGTARNKGAAITTHAWIAFTDAGITLDPGWLEQLEAAARKDPAVSIVYGNYAPRVSGFFEKCATIAYVAPDVPGRIRGKFIASSLMRKENWAKAGGFPDWRATEDLVFMENAEKAGGKFAEAPEAKVEWQLRQNLASTWKRFDLYSKYNVWAGRQQYWHYGIARQYAGVLIFTLIAALYSPWAWLALPAWLLARVAKRCWIHRQTFGVYTIFNPFIVGMVLVMTLVIDSATYSGWIKALFMKQPVSK